ncbi:MAG: hypothetical protein HC822_09640 [Oscillochloris sp.]|nr:hypothetical protein [Oscillochloris sp.]
MALGIQLIIVGVWGALLILHTRRLYRMARVPVATAGNRLRYMRSKIERMWWWLGREEFWFRMQRDVLRCIEATVMALLILISFS